MLKDNDWRISLAHFSLNMHMRLGLGRMLCLVIRNVNLICHQQYDTWGPQAHLAQPYF